jgi:hypothetical protein
MGKWGEGYPYNASNGVVLIAEWKFELYHHSTNDNHLNHYFG